MNEPRPLNPRPIPEDTVVESGGELRPQKLGDFTGQEDIKRNLSVFIRAALERGESLDHVFLNGPPGLGKTTLAAIIANELGVELKLTSAPALEKAKDIVGLLSTIPEGAVVFIDEIHRLKPTIEELLYTAMEDYAIDWIVGQGPGARSVRLPLPAFTLIGATTKAGMVSGPLHTRFGISLRLELYGQEDLADIARRSASILGVHLSDRAAYLLARSSRGTPRIANRLLRRLRDYAQVLDNRSEAQRVTIDEDVAIQGLESLGIDSNGLDPMDRTILDHMADRFGGGPVGADTLAISIGEATETLEDYYEPFLIQLGLIARTPRGRVLTQKAFGLLGLGPRPSGELF